jgi:hypothetical protein
MTIDVPTTERLTWETYRYGALEKGDVHTLESTSQGIGRTLGIPFVQLAAVYERRKDFPAAIRNLNRAVKLSSNPAVRKALDRLHETERDPAGP